MMNEKVQKLLDARNDIETKKQEIEAKLKDIDKELREIESDCRPKPRYEVSGVVIEYSKPGMCNRIPEGTECLRITQRLVNEAEKNEHMKAFGSIMGSWDENRHSVTYFRMNGILLHENGGYLIMKDYVECSDEEWEQIKSGVIAERLLNKFM